MIILGSGRNNSLRNALDILANMAESIADEVPLIEETFKGLLSVLKLPPRLPLAVVDYPEVINHYSTVQLPKRWRRFTKRGKWRSSTLVKLN